MKHTFAVIALFALSMNAAADDGTPIRGPGVQSCGAWTEARREHDTEQEIYDQMSEYGMIAWVQGYLSSFNMFVYMNAERDDLHKNGVFGDTDHRSIEGFLDNYCQENPLDSLHEASIDLITKLMAKIHADFNSED